MSNVRTRILFRSRFLNIYLVRYDQGHRIRPHLDMVNSGRLYKLNWVVVKPREGGIFRCEKNLLNLFGRLVLFRPDLYEHEVSRIERGRRWLLSIAVSLP